MIMQVIQRFVLSLSYHLNVVQNIGTPANAFPKSSHNNRDTTCIKIAIFYGCCAVIYTVS